MNIHYFSSLRTCAFFIIIALFPLPIFSSMPPFPHQGPMSSSAGFSAPKGFLGDKDMPMPSEAELKQLEEQLKKEIDDAVNAMTPEQQKVFFDTMEKLDHMSQTPEGREKLEKLVTGEMSEDELNSFLESIIPEDLKETPESMAPASAAVTTPKAVEPKPTPLAKPTSKQEKLRLKIQNIIDKINSFLIKAGTYSELPGKVSQWQKKGSIELPRSETWNSFRSATHNFVQKLNKLIELDIKTGTFKHLDELGKQETIINQLDTLEQILNQFEPKIEERSTIEMAQMNAASQKAIQKIINALNNTLYVIKLPQEIDLIFTKFEPIAKKSQEEEKAAQEKALLESKKPRPAGRITSAGRPQQPEGGVFIPQYAPVGRRDQIPGPRDIDRFETPRGPIQETRKEGAPAAKGAAKPGREKTEKDKKEQEALAKKEEADKRKAETTQREKEMQKLAEIDPSIGFYADQIIENIEELNTLLKNPTLFGMRAHLVDEKPVDVNLANKIPLAIRLIQDTADLSKKEEPIIGIIADLKKLGSRIKKRKLNPQMVKKLQAELKKSNETLRQSIKPFFEQINEIKKDWNSIKDTVSKEKQYAYLRIDPSAQASESEFDLGSLEEMQARIDRGELTEEAAKKEVASLLSKQLKAKDPLAGIKSQVPPQPFPASIYDLQNALDQLNKVIGSLK